MVVDGVELFLGGALGGLVARKVLEDVATTRLDILSVTQ
jgi:hypothetical protein